LETRLKKWEETQDQLKMEGLRRTFGISEPIRRGMELKVVREGEWRPVVLGGNRKGVHEDILTGKDTSIEWEDVFMGEESRTLPNFHDRTFMMRLRKRLGCNRAWAGRVLRASRDADRPCNISTGTEALA
jgi:hypothetical protein